MFKVALQLSSGNTHFDVSPEERIVVIKSRLYRLILGLVGFFMALIIFIAQASRSSISISYWAVGLPTIVFCIVFFFMLNAPKNVKLLERSSIIAIIVYLLAWDTINLFFQKEVSGEVSVVTTPLVLLAGVLLALVVPSKKLLQSLLAIFSLHFCLTWLKLSHFPWSNLHGAQMISDMLLLISLISLTLLGTYQRMTALANHEADMLRVLAYSDDVTGLPNRRSLYKALDSSKPLGIIMVDIDNFKRINDQFGHQRGDEVLHQVGQILKTIFGRYGVVGRWGGEEYLAVLENIGPAHAQALAEQARQQIERLSDMGCPITVSMGLTQQHLDENSQCTVNRADTLMYNAKANGKNRVELG